MRRDFSQLQYSDTLVTCLLQSTTGAWGFTVPKTVEVPQLPFFAGRRYLCRVQRAIRMVFLSEDHGDSAVAVFSWWSMPLLCRSCSMPAVCIWPVLAVSDHRLLNGVWLSQPAGCRLLASSCSWILTFRSGCNGEHMDNVFSPRSFPCGRKPVTVPSATWCSCKTSSCTDVFTDSVPALLSSVAQLPMSIAIERLVLAWMVC